MKREREDNEPAVASSDDVNGEPVTKKANVKQISEDVASLRAWALQEEERELEQTLRSLQCDLKELIYLQRGGRLLDWPLGSLDPPPVVPRPPLTVQSSYVAPRVRTDPTELPEPPVDWGPGPDVVYDPFLPAEFTTPSPDLLAQAGKDAEVLARISELKRQGKWGPSRLQKIPEPPRTKTHWDFLLDEMKWLANDFAMERKFKRKQSKRFARGCLGWHEAKEVEQLKAVKQQEKQMRVIASRVAKEVMAFWMDIEKLVIHKHRSALERRKKDALDKHLDFLVEQTGKISTKIASDLSHSHGDLSANAGDELSSSVAADGRGTEDESSGGVRDQTPSDGDKEGEEEGRRESSLLHLLGEDEDATLACSGGEDAAAGELSYAADVFDPSDLDESMDEEEDDILEEEENLGGEQELEHLATEQEVPLADLLPEGYEFDPTHGQDAEDERNMIAAASADAMTAMPTGFTLSTTTVKTKVPPLLRGTLREYQHIGLDWLVAMYEKKVNGILADEMGLGKTIQTIALLAHLVTEKHVWGPHLVVVPTSLMLNWEKELKTWCPALKVLTYYGSAKERKAKRTGWSRPNSFHVCITSYNLIRQDHHSFRRKHWHYLILDEAQNIKNFRSQRWQMLLNFNSQRRLLLTGTPLQNSLMELWSLMHFLMPHIFQSHSQFKDWFANPMDQMIEGSSERNQKLIGRLHQVLRPFLLRRLKVDVEKQMPRKHEHVVYCELSKRQRYLYEEFMQRSGTQAKLRSGSYVAIVNVLMQLRKVCNHPDLFEERPIVSPVDIPTPLVHLTASRAVRALERGPFQAVSRNSFFPWGLTSCENMATIEAQRVEELHVPKGRLVADAQERAPSQQLNPPADAGGGHASPPQLEAPSWLCERFSPAPAASSERGLAACARTPGIPERVALP